MVMSEKMAGRLGGLETVKRLGGKAMTAAANATKLDRYLTKVDAATPNLEYEDKLQRARAWMCQDMSRLNDKRWGNDQPRKQTKSQIGKILADKAVLDAAHR